MAAKEDERKAVVQASLRTEAERQERARSAACDLAAWIMAKMRDRHRAKRRAK